MHDVKNRQAKNIAGYVRAQKPEGTLLLRLELPWPNKTLSPNSRVHHMQLAKARQNARHEAKLLALNAVLTTYSHGPLPDCAQAMVSIHFFPPDKRRRDADNLLASMKASIDGLAEALCTDDGQWNFSVFRHNPARNRLPRVVIEVRAAAS